MTKYVPTYKNLTLGILVSLTVCLTTGCLGGLTGPKFQVGDCLTTKREEAWLPVEGYMNRQVIEIGKKHYRMRYASGTEVPLDYADFDYIDRTFEKVSCPKY